MFGPRVVPSLQVSGEEVSGLYVYLYFSIRSLHVGGLERHTSVIVLGSSETFNRWFVVLRNQYYWDFSVFVRRILTYDVLEVLYPTKDTFETLLEPLLHK